MRSAGPGPPGGSGAYRVVGDAEPRQLLGGDEYPVTTARIGVGFHPQTGTRYEHYWFNWVEPERNVLVGWHRDDTHDDLGPVHLQITQGTTPVAHGPAQFIDSHPLDVVERRLDSLRDVAAVEWGLGRPVGFHAEDE